MDTPRRDMEREVEFESGCTLCGGPVAVKFTQSRAVSVCRSCRHIAIARVHLEGDKLVFEQRVDAAA